MRNLPAKKISKIYMQDGAKTKIDNGQRCRRFMPYQVYSPISVGLKSCIPFLASSQIVILYKLINKGYSDALDLVVYSSRWGNGKGGLIIVCFCLQIRGGCQLKFQMEQKVVIHWTQTSFSNSSLVCIDMGKGFITSFRHQINNVILFNNNCSTAAAFPFG